MPLKTWAGHLTIAPGWALFLGQPGDNAQHSHQAVQICLSARTPLSIAIAGAEEIDGSAVAIGSNVPHAIHSDDRGIALLYLDPNGNHGRSVAKTIGSRGFRVVAADRLEGLPRDVAEWSGTEWSDDRSRAIRDRIVRLWVGDGREPLPVVDPRVENAISVIRDRVAQSRISADQLACEVGLSPGRLSVLFRQHTGVAIRPFVLWTRLQRAIETVGDGRSLTDAAHAAGFADSAHLSRTFRRMFGTTLSAGVGHLRIQVLPA